MCYRVTCPGFNESFTENISNGGIKQDITAIVNGCVQTTVVILHRLVCTSDAKVSPNT